MIESIDFDRNKRSKCSLMSLNSSLLKNRFSYYDLSLEVILDEDKIKLEFKKISAVFKSTCGFNLHILRYVNTEDWLMEVLKAALRGY